MVLSITVLMTAVAVQAVSSEFPARDCSGLTFEEAVVRMKNDDEFYRWAGQPERKELFFRPCAFQKPDPIVGTHCGIDEVRGYDEVVALEEYCLRPPDQPNEREPPN